MSKYRFESDLLIDEVAADVEEEVRHGGHSDNMQALLRDVLQLTQDVLSGSEMTPDDTQAVGRITRAILLVEMEDWRVSSYACDDEDAIEVTKDEENKKTIWMDFLGGWFLHGWKIVPVATSSALDFGGNLVTTMMLEKHLTPSDEEE